MAWTYTQDFDGLSTADLDTQDSWARASVGVDRINVSTTGPRTGTKCARGTDTGDTPDYRRTITDVITGQAQFGMKAGSGTAGGCDIRLFSNGNEAVLMRLGSTTLRTRSAGMVAEDTGITVSGNDTWYLVEVDFDASFNSNQGRFRLRVDGGTWTGFYTMSNSTDGAIDQIRFIIFNSDTGSYDDIANSGAAASATNQWLLMGA